MMHYECSTCHTLKPETEYHVKTSNSRGRQYSCKTCWLPRMAKYRAANKEALNAQAQQRTRARKEAKFKAVLKSACEICGATKKLVFDHDHATELYRGTLCLTCNAGLGMFYDNPKLLRAAIRYLR